MTSDKQDKLIHCVRKYLKQQKKSFNNLHE